MLSPRSQQSLFTRPALRGLGEAEREQVASLFRELSLPKGETLYEAGDEPDALYLVVSGAVDVLDGAQVIARYGPGEIFGEAVLLPGHRRLVTTRVALDAGLLVLPRESVARLLEIEPSLHHRMAVHLGQQIARALRVVGGRDRRPGDIVVLEGWTSPDERRIVVEEIASALEAETGRAVSIVTVTADRRSAAVVARGDRPDAVVAGNGREGLRERVAAELAARTEEAPVVLVDLDPDLAGPETGLGDLADTVLIRNGRAAAHREAGTRRVGFVHDDGPPPALGANEVFMLAHDGRVRARALARLARFVMRRSVGLALGSGAAWGLAHIGVLEVLEREGIPIDVIAGASMGAIVGAHYAAGFPPARLEEIATSVQRIRDFLQILPRLLYLGIDFNISSPGMFAGEHFRRVLDAMAPIEGRTFADLEVPFRAVATDITTGARVEIADGLLSDAMRASFSAPWIFSPFRIGEHVVVDGGMSDPVPAETARIMGADLVIGVNVVPPIYPTAQSAFEAALRLVVPKNPLGTRDDTGLPNSFDVIVRILQIMQHELGNHRAAEADALIKPDLRAFWVLEFWKASGIIDEGRRATEAALPAIRAKLDALHREGP